MSCDKLVFDLAQEIEGSANVFIRKDWLNIIDNMNTNYASNQSIVDTSQLANSNKYLSYREAYLQVPLLLTLLGPGLWSAQQASAGNFRPTAGDVNTGAGGVGADYILGLKSWFGQIIHSFTLDYNGTTIIQQTPYINMWNSFKLITSLSYQDILTQGSSIGFYPDIAKSVVFSSNVAVGGAPGPVGLPVGMGTCNNKGYSLNIAGFAYIPNTYQSTAYGGNNSLMFRQEYVNYNPTAPITAGTSYAKLLTANNCTQLWKSYINNLSPGVNGGNAGYVQITVMATIYLKHIHSFFAMAPLLKGVFMKMTMNLNNTSTQIAVVAPVNPPANDGLALTSLSLTSVSNSVGGVNPLMIASGEIGQGSTQMGSGSYLANVSVGNKCLNNTMTTAGVGTGGVAQSIYLYVPAYSFNPVFEQSYLSSPIKQIKYTDVYQYQVINVAAGQPFNNLLTNGIANIKSVLILPFYTAAQSANANNINPATCLPVGVPVYQSPFDPAGTGPTSPLCLFGNFNVVVSGQNAIYNTQMRAYEQFNNQLYGQNAVNGGLTDGLTSSLINSLDFEMEYCYYYVNVSRMLPVEESVPKSVQIIGTNLSARNLDLFCFIEYGVEVNIDIMTGARV